MVGRQAFRGRLPQAPGHAADRRRQDDRTRRAADHRSTSEDPAVLEQPFASAGTSHTAGPIRSRAAGSSASSKWMRTAETEAWTSTGRCLFIRHSRRHSGSQPLRPTGTRTSLIGFLAVLITIGPATAQPAGRTTAVDHLRSLEVECGRAFGHERALPARWALQNEVPLHEVFPDGRITETVSVTGRCPWVLSTLNATAAGGRAQPWFNAQPRQSESNSLNRATPW